MRSRPPPSTTSRPRGMARVAHMFGACSQSSAPACCSRPCAHALAGLPGRRRATRRAARRGRARWTAGDCELLCRCWSWASRSARWIDSTLPAEELGAFGSATTLLCGPASDARRAVRRRKAWAVDHLRRPWRCAPRPVNIHVVGQMMGFRAGREAVSEACHGRREVVLDRRVVLV